MLEDQMRRMIKNLIYIHWYIILVQDLELWEVLLMVGPLMAFKVEMEISSLRDIEWDNYWKKKLDLCWNILLIQDLELWGVL